MNFINISNSFHQRRVHLKISVSLLLLTASSIIFTKPKPFVTTLTTFKNTTPIEIDITQEFEDKSNKKNSIAPGKSFEVVNFKGKALSSVQLTSKDLDKKGNAYGDGSMKFKKSTVNVVCKIALQVVPAHQVPAAGVVPAFKMPASQKIIATLAS